MDLGRQRAHTGVWSLLIEGHVGEKLFLLRWTIGFEQYSHGSDGWVPMLIRLDPWKNVPLLGEPLMSME